LVEGVTPLRVEPALFDSMLAGWRRQQQSRRLGDSIVDARERTVRRFAEFTGAWPWCWTPEQVERWVAAGGWAHSTVRSYQGALAVFLDYVCDARYGWAAECEQQVGVTPVQVSAAAGQVRPVGRRGEPAVGDPDHPAQVPPVQVVL
jgi:integrase/recombinase XerC